MIRHWRSLGWLLFLLVAFATVVVLVEVGPV